MRLRITSLTQRLNDDLPLLLDASIGDFLRRSRIIFSFSGAAMKSSHVGEQRPLFVRYGRTLIHKA